MAKQGAAQDSARMITPQGCKISLSSSNDTISDLHMLLSPFIASIRGQSDLILPINRLSIHCSNDHYHPSRRKQMINLEFIGNSSDNFFKSVFQNEISTGIYDHFEVSLLKMLQTRRLDVALETSGGLVIHEERYLAKLMPFLRETILINKQDTISTSQNKCLNQRRDNKSDLSEAIYNFGTLT
eukprot:TRINITY_DN9839_c0_g1_i2.p1 TRINITY_DN9839_c0_g1~~TRINITY_DN9839_c0_g1_i2.p1  ORF type:complete len:184 (+),score=20.29 TRINITY_DN9839_c0_g1_i2:112-663(+)